MSLDSADIDNAEQNETLSLIADLFNPDADTKLRAARVRAINLAQKAGHTLEEIRTQTGHNSRQALSDWLARNELAAALEATGTIKLKGDAYRE